MTFKSVDWLGQVRDVLLPIDHMRPLFVSHRIVKTGEPPPQPSAPFPEKHPCCELNYIFYGNVTQHLGAEKIERDGGSFMLIGPGIPHRAIRHSYPHRTVSIHFLPTLLFELGPEADGARALARFTSPKNIRCQVVRPPAARCKRICQSLEQMIEISEKGKAGSEFGLRAHFLEILMELLRWDDTAGSTPRVAVPGVDWAQVGKALHHIHEHYPEPVYVEEMARAAGLDANRLQSMFHEGLGTSCVQYLRAYRISRAAVMLRAQDSRVTDVALAVGFETLSHFIRSFRSFMGMSPTEYVRKTCRNGK